MPFDPNWESPTFREKGHSYWWIILVIAAIGVAVYFAMLQQPASPSVPQQKQEAVSAPSAPAEQTSAPTASLYQSAAPSFDSKCAIAAGIVPGSIKREGSKLSFTFKNSGKITIEGSYFEASNLDKKAYRQNSESLEPGKTIAYSVDLDDVSKELGVAVKSFIVLPVQNSKACLNQKLIVIK